MTHPKASPVYHPPMITSKKTEGEKRSEMLEQAHNQEAISDGMARKKMGEIQRHEPTMDTIADYFAHYKKDKML